MRIRNNSAQSQNLDARSVSRFKSSTIFSTSPKRARNLAKARAKMSQRKKRLILPSLVWRNRARKRNASRNKRTVHCRLSVQGRRSPRARKLSPRTRILMRRLNLTALSSQVCRRRLSKSLLQREIWIDLFGYVRAGAIVEFEHRGKGDHRRVIGAQPRFGGFEFKPVTFARFV